jgi:abelson tyrosine-protein kinase 1
MNRMACLRLIERCADSLYSVRAEIADAGDTVARELHDPIAKLVEAFTQVHEFLHRQATRPFLKRYLKRDEILRSIAGCDAALLSALALFSVRRLPLRAAWRG